MKKKSKNNFQKMIAAAVCGCLTMPVVQPVLAEEADWNFWQSYYAQQSAAGVHNDVSNGIIFDDGSSLSTIIDNGQGYFGSYVKDMDQDGMDELIAVGSWYEGGGMDAAKMEVWIYDCENGQVTGTMAYQMYYAGSDSAVMQTSVRAATALIHEKADGSNYVMVLEEGRRVDAAADYVSSSVIEYDGPGQVKELVNVSSAYKESSSDSLFKGYKEEKAVLGLNDLRSETGGDLLLGTLKRENQSSGTTTIRTEYKSLSSVAGGYSTLSDAERYTQTTAPSEAANQNKSGVSVDSTSGDAIDISSNLEDMDWLIEKGNLISQENEWGRRYTSEDGKITLSYEADRVTWLSVCCLDESVSFYGVKVGDDLDDALAKLRQHGEIGYGEAYGTEPDGTFYMMTEDGVRLMVYLSTFNSSKIDEVLISNLKFCEPFDEYYPICNEFQYAIALRQRHPEIDNKEHYYKVEETQQQGPSTMDAQVGRTANFVTTQKFIAGSEQEGEFACYSYNLQQTVQGTENPDFMEACQIWYKENGEAKQLFKWEDLMWCQIDYPVIEYQDTDGNTYIIVNTSRRVSSDYDECLIFGNTGNGEFGLVADLENCRIELEHLSNTLIAYQYDLHLNIETGQTNKIGEQYLMVDIQKGQFFYQ